MSWISWIAAPRIEEKREALDARIDAVNESLERTAWRLRGPEDKTDRRAVKIAVIHDRRKDG